MAQVTVTIDGKAYRMACEEGQESHLTELASQFDRYVGHLKGQFGEIGDLRITVMAGIMVMDEMAEINRRLAAAEAELAGFRDGRDTVLSGVHHREEAMVHAITELAERLNGITRKLTQRQAPQTQA
ncbi:cell division protein ZapA [Rhizobium sp. CRIBSB]|uniref:Cell division protein ZapA n=1 Tax=Peteryoungia aggregata LMG 23059 TaxID=1368425 RepID=A0ABU0G114_9HYPH|nr:cell division protein ZapA [Peteryoungia aggregata]MDQ0419027.1 cell division protein ZapA [Peteryoungia aggregata LMG 23059]NBB48886.1 cell division protein ZapA [Rhizobium sp. CRIBSB]